MDTPKHIIETKFGRVELALTGDNHIHVGTIYVNGGGTNPLTIRNKPYTFSGHYYKWSDGLYHLGQQKDQPWEQMKNAYVTRLDLMGMQATDSVKTLAVLEMTNELQNWVAANPEAMHEADKVRTKELIERKSQDITEARQALAKLEDELEALQDRLTEMG